MPARSETPPPTAARRWGMQGALVGVALVWGSTFVLVKASTARVPVYSFNTLRFSLAAAVVTAFCVPGLRRLGRDGFARGAVLGLFLFGGYAFQTVGLQYTEASKAAFITDTFVVLVPLLSAVLLRRPPAPAALAGALLALAGLALLSLVGSFVPAYGDVLVLGCAVSFAAHIVGLGAWAPRYDPLPLTAVQLAVAGVLHGAVALVGDVGSGAFDVDGQVVFVILFTALLASAAGFWIQTAAQRVLPPTRTAITLTMEPVFAGVFGYLLLGERLGARGWAGCGLILAGMLLAELRAAADAGSDPVLPADPTPAAAAATAGPSAGRAAPWSPPPRPPAPPTGARRRR